MKDDDKKNYYELLRVERDASVEEIKQAYKDIVIVYHPDSNFFSEIVPDASSSPEEIELFKKITNAYQTLINKEKREQYDRKLNQDELNKGVQKTGEWIRPDGSFAKENKIRKKQPTITDLQKLQKDYRERIIKQQQEKEESTSVADMLEESNSGKKIGFLILIWLIGLAFVVSFFLFILFL